MEAENEGRREGKPQPSGGQTEADQLLPVLQHPLRRQIFQAMEGKEAVRPGDVARELEQPLSEVSYHVGVLAESGTIALVMTRPAQGSLQRFYRAVA